MSLNLDSNTVDTLVAWSANLDGNFNDFYKAAVAFFNCFNSLRGQLRDVDESELEEIIKELQTLFSDGGDDHAKVITLVKRWINTVEDNFKRR